MSKICCSVKIELLSDTIFSSGYSIPGGEDISLKLDGNGQPVISASTLKGLLRESLQNLLCWMGKSEQDLIALLGQEGWQNEDDERRLVLTDLHPQNLPANWENTRAFTKLEDGVVATGSFRLASCLNRGLRFTGLMLCDNKDYELLQNAFLGIQQVGLLRNRGFGSVKCSLSKGDAVRPLQVSNVQNVLHYRLKLVTPLSIPWLAQSGANRTANRNYTDSRNYLPGSAMRGFVLSSIAGSNPKWFAENKVNLLTKVQFLNALPIQDEKPSIPTPAGYYGSKDGSEFYTILTGKDVQPGHKRVSLGSFCHINGDKISGFSPRMSSQLRIHRKDRDMFSVRSVAEGAVLEGYICAEDSSVLQQIARVFSEYIWLGADRFAGNGLCKVESLDNNEQGRFAYGYCEADEVPEELYMLLISPTTMMKDGEPVGISEEKLAKLLGVGKVEIQRRATSITESAGFNRTLGCFEPAVTMYSMGSVFKIVCSEAPSFECLRAIEKDGLGIRTAEGYGQVRFLKRFEMLTRADSMQTTKDKEHENAITYRRMRTQWLLDNELPRTISQSQAGTIQALLDAGDKKALDAYLNHNIEEKDPAVKGKFMPVKAFLDKLWEDIQVNEFCSGDEEKMKLVSQMIDLSRKEN